MIKNIAQIVVSSALLLSFPLFASPASAYVNTIYVSPTGSDSASGQAIEEAWEHVQKALAEAEAGDLVLIRGGYYNDGTLYAGDTTGQDWDSLFAYDEDHANYTQPPYANWGFSPTNSGTGDGPDERITFKGYPDEMRPIILGNNPDQDGDKRCGAYIYQNDYITFDSLHFMYGYRGIFPRGTNDNPCLGLTIRHCEICSTKSGDAGDNGGGVVTHAAADSAQVKNLVVENCDIHHNGSVTDGYTNAWNTAGVFLHAPISRLTVRNNRIHDQFGGVIIKSTQAWPIDSVYVSNNDIYNIGTAGIVINSAARLYTCRVYHNYIYGPISGGAGIIFGGTTSKTEMQTFDTHVYNNTIDCDNSMDGIYSEQSTITERTDTVDCTIVNNIFHDPVNVISMKLETPNDPYDCCYWPAENSIIFNSNLIWESGEDSTTTIYFAFHDNPRDSTYSIRDFRIACDAENLQGFTQESGSSYKFADPEFTTVDGNEYVIDSTSPAATGGYGEYASYIGAYDPGGDEADPAPEITWFAINGGDESTDSREVTLNNTCTGSPTEYIASESSDFSGSSWHAYSAAPVFQLSSGYGTKTVYLKVGNGSEESNPLDDAIIYAEQTVVDTGNLVAGQVPLVDGTYSGYDPAQITDGNFHTHDKEASTWASTADASDPHWIEFDLGQPQDTLTVVFYWAYNVDVTYWNWTTSQMVIIESGSAGSFSPIDTLISLAPREVSYISVELNGDDHLRLWQPPNSGPESYSSILWVAEVEIFPGDIRSPMINLQNGERVED